jgi:hypothetical protein
MSTPATSVSHGGDAGVYESQRTKQYWGSEVTLRGPLHGADHHRSGERRQGQQSRPIGRRPSRKNTDPSEPSPLLDDPHPYNYEVAQKSQVTLVYGNPGRAGKSRTDLRTFGDRNESRVELNANGSRELPVHGLVFVVSETYTGLNLLQDPGDDYEGKYWVDRRRDNRAGSRVFSFPSQILGSLTSDIGEGSGMDLSESYRPGGQSRNTSRAPLPLVLFRG